MPLSDFEEKTEMKYDLLPDDKYVCSIDDAKGDCTNGKAVLKVTYRVLEGTHKNRLIWKDYYISEKTCQKFLPWQFGILGIWKDVRDADSFEGGVMKAIDGIGEIMKANTKFIVQTTQEEWEWNDKSGIRVNAVVMDNLGESNTISSDDVSGPDVNANDELPF